MLPIPEIPAKLDLEAHRNFLLSVGDMLSGRSALPSEDSSVIFVYRHPSDLELMRCPQLGDTNFGRVIPNTQGGFSVNGVAVYSIDTPLDALGFLTSLLHLVTGHRRELSMHANRKMERNAKSAFNGPPGTEGHLLKEYDQLIEDIKHEYFYQRDRLSPNSNQ
jgi:hypothetical protein